MGSDPLTSDEQPDPNVSRMLARFAELNRRRLLGSPVLELHEVEQWMDLRERLGRHFERGDAAPSEDAEGRSSIRLPIGIRVRFEENGPGEDAAARNLSCAGIFLATPHPLAAGSRVRLHFEDPGTGAEHVIEGCVAWARREARGGRPAGMGIGFGVLDARDRAFVERLAGRASKD